MNEKTTISSRYMALTLYRFPQANLSCAAYELLIFGDHIFSYRLSQLKSKHTMRKALLEPCRPYSQGVSALDGRVHDQSAAAEMSACQVQSTIPFTARDFGPQPTVTPASAVCRQQGETNQKSGIRSRSLTGVQEPDMLEWLGGLRETADVASGFGLEAKHSGWGGCWQ